MLSIFFGSTWPTIPIIGLTLDKKLEKFPLPSYKSQQALSFYERRTYTDGSEEFAGDDLPGMKIIISESSDPNNF